MFKSKIKSLIIEKKNKQKNQKKNTPQQQQ